MAHMDDIFNIDHYMHQKSVPKSIKQAWKRHRELFCLMQEQAERYKEIRGAISTIAYALQPKRP